ncbi:MAG: hypothetical protein WBM44_02045 [Waterburya sp.]
MNTCPNCSHNLLSHLRSHNRYWYCQHCRSETSESYISAKNKAILHKSLLLSCDRSSLVASNFSI